MRRGCAVDDEGSARQRLEGGGDIAVGVEVMRPGKSAQALRQFWESVRVELWYRTARLRCKRLLFVENERSLKNHAGELFRRPYPRSAQRAES
jgi:hypothetical protein